MAGLIDVNTLKSKMAKSNDPNEEIWSISSTSHPLPSGSGWQPVKRRLKK